jgi:APA family basic amino acid/polyamine antiporter
LGSVTAVLGVNRTSEVPAAVIAVGIVIAVLVMTGSVETAWAFSAFTVLIYYAVTNLAALRLPKEQRLSPRGLADGGLIACLFLAWWVPPPIWLAGVGLILAGLVWHAVARRAWHLDAGRNQRA